ncbi:MAG: glycosyltransferase [Bacteroidetes bacterium]|jgi:glycosyltransferase involved in cell wall biosynthesis|nr:glycosyltransferase [Bacteroidota bacterium]
MQIDLVFPKMPPATDGIGDHTARLAEALVQSVDVRVHTSQDAADPVPGVDVVNAFRLPPRRGILDIGDSVGTTPPDWLLVQFNQFSYGRWGLNPFLPLALYRLKQQHPPMNLAVLFHEDFVPVTSFENGVMTTWQRAQFWCLGALSDRIFFSIRPWRDRYRSWFPSTPVNHLPVGSNIPRLDADRRTVRQEIGIGARTPVLGVFGSLHASRLLTHIRAAYDAIGTDSDSTAAHTDPLLLYIGPDGADFERAMGRRRVHSAGCLPGPDVSRHFRAMDVYLAPFVDGVSTRRGSFMTGLQHGTPTVSTLGPLTDQELQRVDGQAACLAPADEPASFARAARDLMADADRRQELGETARALYDRRFSFDVIADSLLTQLCETVPS